MRRWGVPLLVVSVLGACNGGISQNAPSDEGGVEGGAGCSVLSTCCAMVSGASGSLCQEVVRSGDSSYCVTELGQLQAEGDCLSIAVGGTSGSSSGVDASASSGSSGAASSSSGGSASSSSGVYEASNSSTSSGVNPYDGSGGGPVDSGVTSDSSPPPTCTGVTCGSSQVCSVLAGGSSASCVSPCIGDADCPAFTHCQNGSCGTQCPTCAAGYQCQSTGAGGGRRCSSNNDCPLGSYCDQTFLNMCSSYQACVACSPGGCTTCTTNSQCSAGQVCVNQACTTCTADSQCGPAATCTATHTSLQCTCSHDSDCAAGEGCSSGICAALSFTQIDGGCSPGFIPGCSNGLTCINGLCRSCTTFADCNGQTFGPGGPSGYACINGKCESCTANSQCGGGMACVQGTCGTCSANSQCGAHGTCTNGYCVCTSDQGCDTGERCGSGVCVTQ